MLTCVEVGGSFGDHRISLAKVEATLLTPTTANEGSFASKKGQANGLEIFAMLIKSYTKCINCFTNGKTGG